MYGNQQFCNSLPHRISRAATAALAIAIALMPTVLSTQPAQAQTFSVLHSFTGLDGEYPYSGVTIDAQGNLYGTTFRFLSGYQAGTVFRLKPSVSGYTLNLLHVFAGIADGALPYGGVAFGPDGALYGTTSLGGGSDDFGVIFAVRPPATICKSALCPWMETVLSTFMFQTGSNPAYGELAFDRASNIYGTTEYGGPSDYGTVYKLSRVGQGWTETVLHAFAGESDGRWPLHSVVLDSSGNLYGTTFSGGPFQNGTVFQLVPSGSRWIENIIAAFPPGIGAGSNPQAGLFIDQAGHLYGATSGSGGTATVFELSHSGSGWQFTVLHTFTTSETLGPVGNLVMDNDGNLYGTTYSLGAYGQGNVFELSPSESGWIYTDLHDFTGGNDGSLPTGDLTVDARGNLYGTTSTGGHGLGVVFELTP